MLGVKILTPCDVLVVLRFAGLCGVVMAGFGDCYRFERHGWVKGTVARDLLASDFFMDLLYMGLRFSRLKGFSFLFRFHEVIRRFR